MNYAGADMQMAELWDRYAAACTDRNALAAQLARREEEVEHQTQRANRNDKERTQAQARIATLEGIADARMARIEGLEAALREIGRFCNVPTDSSAWSVYMMVPEDLRSTAETDSKPADGTIDGDGVWQGGKWCPSPFVQDPTRASPNDRGAAK